MRSEGLAALSCCSWLALSCALWAAAPEGAVLAVMRKAAPEVAYVQILNRLAVDRELDLVVALGTPKDRPAGEGSSGWWGNGTTLSILLQRRDRPGAIYQIAARKGEGDCLTRVERATARDVVLSCTPEKGMPGPNHKFVYDLRSKALVKEIKYQPYAMERIFASGGGFVLVGSDTRQVIAVKYNPTGKPVFEVLRGAQATPWTRRVETGEASFLSGTEEKHLIYVKPRQFEEKRFGPGGQFRLSEEDRTKNEPPEKRLLVLEGRGGTAKRYRLPQSSYDDFARARPGRVRNGYVREGTTIDEAISAWQIAEGALWFAKGFYDEEGTSGVGGFGYFDTGERRYRTWSPREVANWSTTAMLVTPEAVWLGLANNGEYGSTGGGLLRFERATRKVERIEFSELVSEMASAGNRLLLATDFGAAIVEGGALRRFFVDEDTNGQLRVAEAVVGE